MLERTLLGGSIKVELATHWSDPEKKFFLCSAAALGPSKIEATKCSSKLQVPVAKVQPPETVDEP